MHEVCHSCIEMSQCTFCILWRLGPTFTIIFLGAHGEKAMAQQYSTHSAHRRGWIPLMASPVEKVLLR